MTVEQFLKHVKKILELIEGEHVYKIHMMKLIALVEVYRKALEIYANDNDYYAWNGLAKIALEDGEKIVSGK